MIFSKHSGYTFDGRRLCHKGGSSGTQEMRQMEEDRQKRVQAAVDTINDIFDPQPYARGVNAATTFDPTRTYYNADGSPLQPSAETLSLSPGSKGATTTPTPTPTKNVYWQRGDYANSRGRQHSPVEDVFYRLKYGSALDALANGQLYTGVETVTPQNPREKLYDEQKQAVYDINAKAVGDQYEDAERTNRFGLARNGLLGGSTDVDSNARLQERTNKGLVQAQALGEQEAGKLRTADEQSKASLIAMAQSGIDTGTAQQMAAQQLASNAQTALGARAGSTLDNLFSNMGQAYLSNKLGQAVQNGYNLYGNQYGHSLNTNKQYQGSQY